MSNATRTEAKTQWTGWIRYQDTNAAPRGIVAHAGIGAPTLSEFLSQVFSIGTYYHGAGYDIVIATEMQRVCCECGGAGVRNVKITASCPTGERKCKACKGQGVFETLSDVALLPHSNVKIDLKAK